MKATRKLRLSCLFTFCLFQSTIVVAEETVMDSLFKGMAYEIGGRVMGAIIDNITQGSRPKSKLNWYPGAYHPRYPNVIADTSPNVWKPADGYVWGNPNDTNDWTVIPKNISRASYFLQSDSNKPSTHYQVVYSGSDGVNLRSAPGGKDILATAFKQSVVLIQSLSTRPYLVRDIPWVKVKLIGWMARP